MHESGIEVPTATQRSAARVAGAAYLLAIPLAMFPEFYIPSRLYGPSWTETASGIAAHLSLFRVGIASNLLVFTVDVGLICALYLVLKPIRPGLAICALVFRVIETTLLLGVVVNDVAFASYLTRAAAGTAADVASTTASSIIAHGDIYAIGLFFAGLGSMSFGWLWAKSRYVPLPLALLGIAASTLLACRELLWVAAPATARGIGVSLYGGPIFLFELIMGLWLLAVGLRSRLN
jgi:hypothetical protein